MSSKLFAFQLARPSEPSEEPMSCKYDPQTQTMVWQGGTPAQASGVKMFCTNFIGGAVNCEIYYDGCFTSPNCELGWGWLCDSRD